MSGRRLGFLAGTIAALIGPTATLAFQQPPQPLPQDRSGFYEAAARAPGYAPDLAAIRGYHPAGAYLPAAPAFHRTPSFSIPSAYALPHYVNGVLRPGNVDSPITRAEAALAAGDLPATPTVIGYQNRYLGYHRDWLHGYWNGHYPGGWGWRAASSYPGYGYWGGYGGGPAYGGLGWGLRTGLGTGLGVGVGYGLSSWLFGPMVYNWGLSDYDNPYYVRRPTATVAQPATVIYDYSRPIDAIAAPPAVAVADQAVADFAQARAAFRDGHLAVAVKLTDQALARMPNDPSLHEFRALAMFALGRYDEAAAALYAVLSVGPGWDWSTMIGLYPDTETYTRQLRALEAYGSQNPKSAQARFVLAYHYLTAGHAAEAIGQLKDVVALQPRDRLSAQLLQQLQPTTPIAVDGGPIAPAVGTGTRPATTPSSGAAEPARAGTLAGTWNAQPSPDTTIALTFKDQGHFTWKVLRSGRDHRIEGASTYAEGVLTLAPDPNNALVGEVVWDDPTHFHFKVLGGRASDPGLTFTKSS